MSDSRIAIIGEYTPDFRPHRATNEALAHVLASGHYSLDYHWISTQGIENQFEQITAQYQGYWIAPGSPYQDMQGALRIIGHTRLKHIPTLGTCGGYQHMVIEFARNVLGLADAQHAEYNPYASQLLVKPLSCALKGQKLAVEVIDQGSQVSKILGKKVIEEEYYCDFGLNPAYQQKIHEAGFRIVGSDVHQEARILELEGHPFFIATLFVPQVNSSPEMPHPLVRAFVEKVCNGDKGNKAPR